MGHQDFDDDHPPPHWIITALFSQGVMFLMIGFPLFFIPKPILYGAGWLQPDSLTARLLGSALISLGGGSLMVSQADRKTIYYVLNFFLLFNVLALGSLFVSVLEYEQQRPIGAMAVASVFTCFSLFWAYSRGKLTWNDDEELYE